MHLENQDETIAVPIEAWRGDWRLGLPAGVEE
jgi:hypothetical protein